MLDRVKFFITFNIPNSRKIKQGILFKLFYVQFVRPEEEEVGEEDSMELQRLARREKNRPVNV
jgi:hypothetical protein